MKNIIYVLAMALLWGCDSTITPDDNVKIRIENASEFNMDCVKVAYPQ